MKKSTCILLLSLACCWLAAQCPAGDVTFSTQGQIDSFQINYPGCTDMPGSIRISGSDISNLLGLSTLDSIGGCLKIFDNPQLISLSGLKNLSYVGYCTEGSFFVTSFGLLIQNNAVLTSLAGLENLKSVRAGIAIDTNSSLSTLSGLNNLSTVGTCTIQHPLGGSGLYSLQIVENKSLKAIDSLVKLDTLGILKIAGNDSLASLHGLGNLYFVEDLYIEDNPSLPDFKGLENLHTLGNFIIRYNTSLTGFNDLDSLKTLYGQLLVEFNDSLKDFSGLENLGTIGAGFYVGNNAILKDFSGLGNLQFIGADFLVEYNGSLTNFQGLGNLKSIGCTFFFEEPSAIYTLRVRGNYSLVDFTGLENLQSISCWTTFSPSYLWISENTSLQTIEGLGGSLDASTILLIKDNSKLSTCEVPLVCNHVQDGGPASISGNAPGCNSVAEVEAACVVSIEETSGGEPVVIFSPNPAGDFLQIQIDGNEKWDISLFDLQGRQMYRHSVSGSRIIEIEDWPAGVYALRAVSGGRAYTGRFVKE